MKPRLCLDHSYSLPGLPRPTIKCIVDCRLPIETSELTFRRPEPKISGLLSENQSAIGNRQLGLLLFLFLFLLFLGRGLALFFLLALADYFGLGGNLAFDRRHDYLFFLDDADG